MVNATEEIKNTFNALIREAEKQVKANPDAKYIVCMWSNGVLEIPCYHFRKSLVEICPKNEDAIFVGHGEDVLKTLKVTMP